MEAKTYWKGITYAPRMDYVSFQANEFVYVARGREAARRSSTAQGRLDADAPLRAEPDPLAPRLARNLGARAGGDLDVLVLLPRAGRDPRPLRDGLPGSRMHTRYFQAGGLAEDIPVGFYDDVPRVLRHDARARSTSTRRSSTGSRSGSSGRRAIGLLSAEDAIALGQSGPVLRASGVDWDIRKARAVPRVRRGRLRRPRVPERRRLRPLQGADERDARVGAHRPPVPRRDARTGRGSPTTARSCSRRGTSCTPRWRA